MTHYERAAARCYLAERGALLEVARLYGELDERAAALRDTQARLEAARQEAQAWALRTEREALVDTH